MPRRSSGVWRVTCPACAESPEGCDVCRNHNADFLEQMQPEIERGAVKPGDFEAATQKRYRGLLYWYGTNPEDVPDADAYAALRAWTHARDYHVLPQPGGWDDQPGYFCAACDILTQLQARHERAEIDRIKTQPPQGAQPGAAPKPPNPKQVPRR